MSNSNDLYWKRCTCPKHVKLGIVSREAKGGAYYYCKNCGRYIEAKYEGETELVESASVSLSASAKCQCQ